MAMARSPSGACASPLALSREAVSASQESRSARETPRFESPSAPPSIGFPTPRALQESAPHPTLQAPLSIEKRDGEGPVAMNAACQSPLQPSLLERGQGV